MNDKFFEVQKQIRDNQLTITEYMKDYSKWEKEINSKDTLLIKEVKTYKKEESIQIKKEYNEKNNKNKEIIQNLKRDSTSIKNYYDNWNKFDVDMEIKEIEEDEKTIIKPYDNKKTNKDVVNQRIDIKNMRLELYDPKYSAEMLKRDGVSFFKIKNYNKAIEFFSLGLKVKDLNDENILGSLYNNRGNCYLKQNIYKEAIKDFEEAFKLNRSEIKTIYRLAFSYYKMNNEHLSLRLIQYSKENFKEILNEGSPEGELFSLLEKDCFALLENKKRENFDRISKVIYDDEYEDNEKTDNINISEIDINEEGLIYNIAKENTIYLNEVTKSKKEQIENNEKATQSKDKQLKEVKEIKLNEKQILSYINEVSSRKENITASEFRLTFSNLSKKEMMSHKVSYLKSIEPERLPIIFKNDLDKEILKEILSCLYEIMNDINNQELVIRYLFNISNINRFSFIIKFLKKEEYLKIFDMFDMKYDSMLIGIKDKFFK